MSDNLGGPRVEAVPGTILPNQSAQLVALDYNSCARSNLAPTTAISAGACFVAVRARLAITVRHASCLIRFPAIYPWCQHARRAMHPSLSMRSTLPAWLNVC